MRNLIFIWLCLFCVIPSQARTITVDDDGPADFNNIQAAIDDANDGDIVVIHPGTYTGDGNRDIDFLGKAVTVRSTDPNDLSVVASTVIDCNGTHDNQHRGFGFHRGEDANSVLAGLTITNGYSYMGGAIFCYRSSPTITNCILSGNTALDEGGAITGWYNAEFPRIINCTIKDNSGRGAVWGCNGPIKNCTISNNAGGGLIMCHGQIINCSIKGNYGESGLSFCSGQIVNCCVSGNWGGWAGGGLSFCEGQVVNCIISGNSSTERGGGVYCLDDSVEIVGCTITGNTSAHGGAIYCMRNSHPEVTNSVLWGNWPEEIYVWNDAPVIRYSNIAGGWPGEGNIDLDPCFVEAGYWGDANDPNIIVEPNDPNSIWVEGDYHLLNGSPCIDSGDPNYVGEPGETDLDGRPRVIGGRVDMGAYEYESVPVLAVEAVIKISPRTLNLQSKGRWIMCVIRLPEDYNVADIDSDSVFLEDEVPAERVWLGDEFAVAKFSRGEVQEMLSEVQTPSEVELVVSGELSDGTIFEGADTIRVIDVGGGKNTDPPGKAIKQLNRNRKRIKGP